MNPPKNEIFSAAEKIILEKRKNESKITPEQYKKILKAEKEKIKVYEDIDNSLDNLENTTMKIDKIIDEKIKLIEKFYENESKKETSKNKIKELSDKALAKKGKDIIDKKLPGAGKVLGFFEKLSNAWDKAGKIFDEKGFIAAVMVFFGVIFGSGEENKKEKEKKSIKQVVINPDYDGIEELGEQALSISGFNILKGLSGIEFEKKNNSQYIFNKLKDKKQYDIQDTLKKCINSSGEPIPSEIDNLKKEFGINEKYSGKEIYNVLSALSNDYINIIYSQRLNPERLKDILLDRDGKVIKKYKGLFTLGEIEQLKNGNLDYRNLNIKNISILISISFSSFLISGIGQLGELGINSFNYIMEDGNLDEGLKEELKSRKDKLLPIKIIYSLGINVDGNGGIDYSIEELEKNDKYSKLEDLDKLKIKKFIKFKDDLLEKIINNKIFNLGIENFNERLKDDLALNNIILLFTLLDGNINLNNDTINKVLYYSWLMNITSNNSLNNSLKGEIQARLYSVIMDKNKKDILSENDKKIIVVVMGKTLGITIGIWEKHISNTLNMAIAPLKKELEKLGVSEEYSRDLAIIIEGGTAFAIGFILRKSWIGKALIFSGALLPVIGYFVSKVGIEGIKKEIGDKMYKELNELTIGETEINGKKVKIKGLEDMSEAYKDIDKYIEESEKVDRFEYKGVEFSENHSSGLVVTYEGVEHIVDVGPVLFDFDAEHDDYLNKINVTMTSCSIDKNGKKIIIGNGNPIIEIPMELIYKKLKQGNYKNEIISREYLTLIDNTSNRKKQNNFFDHINKFMDNNIGRNDLILVKK